MGERRLAGDMGEGGTWTPLGSFADRGFANGEGGIMTRGDCGLILRLTSESAPEMERTDSFDAAEIVELVEDSEPVEFVLVSGG